MKTCSKCNQAKVLSEFFKDKGVKDGHANMCKECKTEATYAWREKNKDKYNSYMRAANKARYPDARLKRYDVDDKWFKSTLESQGHRCAICEKENPSTKRCLATDHNHVTGTARGLLCYGCNRYMALLDNPALMEKAAAYKKKHDDAA